jgi:carbon-monoxide dehydrogenase iron sulfur subunit
MRLLVYKDKCTGCRLCTLVCSLKHEGICNPAKSRIRVERQSVAVDLPIVCRQCEKPPCVTACPYGALSRDSNGAIRVDENLCTACGLCLTACPFDAIRIHPSRHVAMICDLCDGDPQCAKHCVLEALKVM